MGVDTLNVAVFVGEKNFCFQDLKQNMNYLRFGFIPS